MSNSISDWLTRLKAGDAEAAQPLFERYFRRLVELAQGRLRGLRARMADGEDVALSAFTSFCAGVQRGRFPRLDDRDDLWRILVTITARKAVKLLALEGRLKRGGGAAPADGHELDEVIGSEPSPEFAAQTADECAARLGGLPDDSLRQVALGKMEGLTNQEIATRLNCAPRTVERKLGVIRALWQSDAP